MASVPSPVTEHQLCAWQIGHGAAAVAGRHLLVAAIWSRPPRRLTCEPGIDGRFGEADQSPQPPDTTGNEPPVVEPMDVASAGLRQPGNVRNRVRGLRGGDLGPRRGQCVIHGNRSEGVRLWRASARVTPSGRIAARNIPGRQFVDGFVDAVAFSCLGKTGVARRGMELANNLKPGRFVVCCAPGMASSWP